MSEEIKIQCKNCIYWKNQHCESFPSKWFGMVTAKSQNCGKFKPKNVDKEQAKDKPHTAKSTGKKDKKRIEKSK